MELVGADSPSRTSPVAPTTPSHSSLNTTPRTSHGRQHTGLRHSYKQYNSTSSQTDIVDFVEQVDAVIEYNNTTIQPQQPPTYTWQRSASCKELRKPGDTNEAEKAIIIPKYERNFIVAGSKTPSFDRTAIEQDAKVYSSSYPGTTSSLSTESADEIEPGGSVLVIDTGSSREFSHDDISHDSYELLERERSNYIHSRSCSIGGSSGEGLPEDEIFVMDDLKDVVEKRLGYVEPRYRDMDFNEFNEKCKQGIAKFRERNNVEFNEFDAKYKPLVGYDESSPHYPVERTKSEPFVSDFWRVARQHRKLFHQKSFDYTPAESVDVDERGINSKSAADIPYTLHKRQQMNGTAPPCFECRSPVSPRRSFEKQPTPESEKKKTFKPHDKLSKTKHDSELNSQDSGLSLSLGADSIDEIDDPSSRNIFNFKIEKKPSKEESGKHRLIPVKKDLLKVSSEDGPRNRGLLVKTKALSADSGLRKASSFDRTPPVEVIKIDSQDGEGIVICSSDDKNISLDTSDPDVIIVEYHSKRKRAFQKRSASDGKGSLDKDKRVGSLDSQRTDTEFRRGKLKDWKSESTGTSCDVIERPDFLKREKFSKELKTSIEGKVVRETREEKEMKKQRSEELQKQKVEDLRKQQSEELQKSKCEELRRQRSALQKPVSGEIAQIPKVEDLTKKTKLEEVFKKSKPEENTQNKKTEVISPKTRQEEITRSKIVDNRLQNVDVIQSLKKEEEKKEVIGDIKKTPEDKRAAAEHQIYDRRQEHGLDNLKKTNVRSGGSEKIQVFQGDEHLRKRIEYQQKQRVEDLYKIQKDDSLNKDKNFQDKNEIRKNDRKPQVPPKKVDLLKFAAENKLKAKEKSDMQRTMQKQEKVVFEVSVEINNSSTDMTYCTCEHDAVPEIPEAIPEESGENAIQEPTQSIPTLKKAEEKSDKPVIVNGNKSIDRQGSVKQITSPEVAWKKFGELPPIINKRERSPILFARLGFSEGSAFIPTHTQSPASSRRAKSLETPVVSLHRLPPITSFSSKDDTVDNDEGIELEEKTLKSIKPLHRENVIEEEDVNNLSPVVTAIQFKSDNPCEPPVSVPEINEILEKEEIDKLIVETIELQKSSSDVTSDSIVPVLDSSLVSQKIVVLPFIQIQESSIEEPDSEEIITQAVETNIVERDEHIEPIKKMFPIVPTVEIEESSDLSADSDEDQELGVDQESANVVPVVSVCSRPGDEQKVPEFKLVECQDSSEPSMVCDEEDDYSFSNNDVFDHDFNINGAKEKANRIQKLPHLEPSDFFVDAQPCKVKMEGEKVPEATLLPEKETAVGFPEETIVMKEKIIQEIEVEEETLQVVEEEELVQQLPIGREFVQQVPVEEEEFDQHVSVEEEFDQHVSVEEEFDQHVSVEEEFVQHSSVEEDFVQHSSIEDDFVQHSSMEDEFVQHAPIKEEFVQRVPIEKEHGQHVPIEEQFVQHEPIEKDFVQHVPIEEKFVQHVPIEEEFVQHVPLEQEFVRQEGQPERRPSTRQERLDSFKNTKSYSVEIWTSEETDVPNVPTIDIEDVDWENDDDAFMADPIAMLKEHTSPKEKSFPNVNVMETNDCKQITIESSYNNIDEVLDVNEVSDSNEVLEQTDGSEFKLTEASSSNENVSSESNETPIQPKEDINTLSALCEKIEEPAHLDLKFIPPKRSFDDDVSSSSSIKPDKTSTWKPFSLESSGSSSLEEGIFPPDDCSHFADEEEGSSNSTKEEYQGFGYSNAGAELIIGGYTGGIFGLSRTLSRISERSTTSEQERSDFDDDISTKPSSRSLSVEDESLLSSDRQPSLSSDPSTNPEIEEQPLPPLPPEPLGFKIPPPLLHNEEEWPSPPNSSFDTPIISSVETYYMEFKPEEATKVVLPRDVRQYDSSSDSEYENKTLQEDDAPDSSTTLESTVKLLLKPKRQGNSSDTSIAVSDFSSSTSTVKHCQHYSTCTAKSDDSSLAEFGSSLSTEMLVSSRKNSDDSISLRRRSYQAHQRSFDDYDSPYSESDEGSKQHPTRRSYGANLPSPTGSTGGRKCSSGGSKSERRGACKGVCSKSIARAKCYSYYSLTRSPPSDGSSSSLEMGEPPTTPNTIPRVSKRRRHVPPNKRRHHRLSADVDTRDGHLISMSSPSVVAAAAAKRPQFSGANARSHMSKQSSV